MKANVMRILKGFSCFLLAFFFTPHCSLYAQSTELLDGLNWLRSQMQFDFDPTTGVAKLVKSYETTSIVGAWVYDQAIAVIAFTAAGDDSSARLVLNALQLKQAVDGSWDFAYAYNTGAKLDTRILVGTNAWAIIAIAQYELMTRDDSYRDMAVANINWLLQFRNDNSNDESFGAFVMGPDHISTTWDESTVYSTEHNVDVYAAMRLMYELTGEQQYQTYADEIYHYLVTEMWNPSADSNDSFANAPPIFWVGLVDYTKYLDPQSWTVAAIGATGPNGEDFTQSLDWAYNDLRVTDASVHGVTGINGFDVNASFDLPVDKVWSEGSEGMVTAYFSTGDPDDSTKAVFFHNETKRYQSPNGGVPYATNNSDGWVSFNSVAGTAWFVFNELRINPFQVNKAIATNVHGHNSQNDFSIPADFRLGHIYPSRPAFAIKIPFRIQREISNSLSVYNLLGEEIRVLSNSRFFPGEYVQNWDGRNQQGHKAPSGLYFIVMQTDRQVEIRKAVLFR